MDASCIKPGSWMRILPVHQQPAFPLQPRKEPLFEPLAGVAPQAVPILVLQFAGGTLRRNQIHPILLEGGI